MMYRAALTPATRKEEQKEDGGQLEESGCRASKVVKYGAKKPMVHGMDDWDGSMVPEQYDALWVTTQTRGR